MITRIDLFMPPRSQYGVLHHFTKKMHEALNHIGVNCRLLEAEYSNPAPFLEALMNDPPNCTLSFNGLLPDDKGRFFCEMINIPHVACIVDSQNLFIPLVHSPLSIIACSDRFSCDFFRGLNCRNVVFMPHAVEKGLKAEKGIERQYDVSVLCSLIDYEAKRAEWNEKYGKALCIIMDEAVEATLSDNKTSYVQALVESVDKHMEFHHALDPRKIDFISVMDDIEMYIKGKSRIDIIKAVKDAPVHIFGAAQESAPWQKYLGDDCPNVIIHEAVPYQQAIEILKQSKILLNSCPWIKNGAHERIFYGLACGALVITNDNIYLSENFQDNENIVLYQNDKLEEVNNQVNEYLADEDKRRNIAEKGRQLVMKKHTWEARAKQLVKELAPILDNIQDEMLKKEKGSENEENG